MIKFRQYDELNLNGYKYKLYEYTDPVTETIIQYSYKEVNDVKISFTYKIINSKECDNLEITIPNDNNISQQYLGNSVETVLSPFKKQFENIKSRYEEQCKNVKHTFTAVNYSGKSVNYLPTYVL